MTVPGGERDRRGDGERPCFPFSGVSSHIDFGVNETIGSGNSATGLFECEKPDRRDLPPIIDK
ncbi:hypothetical protein [Burkholderia pseudomultivorans]|uniref:hypothetical protein n=1 Tax=Burkholderia pseudomultivorans TaxID=1207504 RepID=UPI00287085B0|nr:hypothetical protein [Burkholderia pseudomultivorans]